MNQHPPALTSHAFLSGMGPIIVCDRGSGPPPHVRVIALRSVAQGCRPQKLVEAHESVPSPT
jgi:hypothetical protein